MSLSARGKASINTPPSYQALSASAWNNPYSDTNPTGVIDMSIAENNLSVAHIARRISHVAPIPPDQLVYTSMHGSASTLAALSSFLQAHLFKRPVSPDHLALVAGAGAALDLLATTLAEAGQRAIVTAPGYSGFKKLLAGRARVRLVMADVESSDVPRVRVSRLQRAWKHAGEQESAIRFVVITSPDNPTGRMLSPACIRDIVAWARQRDLHIIFDEIYALSVHNPKKTFVSVVEALDGDLRNDVHVVWSMSKDFCLSGLRAGVLYSQNHQLMRAVRTNLAYFCSTSRHTQWLLSHLLSNHAWVESFVAQNKKRLRLAYIKCTELLKSLDVPFFSASAGFFVWIDLRKWMLRDEIALWKQLVKNGVLLTPGTEAFSPTPGFFRLCFAAVSPAALEVAFRRIATVLADLKS